ncbi:MAG: phospholipid carrier-dependent glycosyltransferase [Candidatus Curtissbacteria bacterium]|nr:phospholipid carrier-dependent glycosyltransferase [Candidatus Curtissbacteria bacterium]
MSLFKSKFLILIVLVGVGLRFLGLNFGSPSLYVSNDEAITQISAYTMIAQKTIKSQSYYTPLSAYIQIPFIGFSYLYMKTMGNIHNIDEFRQFVITHEGYFLFIPRFYSAFFGTLTILLIYHLTKLLFENKRIAMLAALLASFSFNLVHMSHFARPWPEAMFFLLLALYFCLKRQFLWAFICAIVSYGFLQIGIFSFPLIFLFFEKKYLRQFIIGLLLSAFSVLILSRLVLHSGFEDALLKLRPDSFIGALFRHESGILAKLINNLTNPNLFFIIRSFAKTDFVILLFGTLSVFGFRTFSKQARLVFYFLIANFVFALFFLYPVLHYFNIAIFLLIPFAAFATWNGLKWRLLENSWPLKFFTLTVIFFVAGFNSFYWNYIFLKEPTFIQARDWIARNINPREPIAYLGGRYQTFVPSKEAILNGQKFQPNYYQEATVLSGNYLPNMRNIVYTAPAGGKTKMEKLNNATGDYPISYVIDYYYYPKDSIYSQNPNLLKKVATFSPLKSGLAYRGILPEALYEAASNFESYDNGETFSMYSLERTGPYFDILKFK